MPQKLLFQEDECLRKDPTYPGVRAWYREQFDSNFDKDWDDAESSEVDQGDTFWRKIVKGNRTLAVRFDYTQTYSVYLIGAV